MNAKRALTPVQRQLKAKRKVSSHDDVRRGQAPGRQKREYNPVEWRGRQSYNVIALYNLHFLFAVHGESSGVEETPP